MHVSGSFDVDLKPLEVWLKGAEGLVAGRLSIEKSFRGGLVATSLGEMLSARTAGGAAGYVAVEQVCGTLAGRPGTFVLQHLGTMHADSAHLILEVLPGSGTGGLAGLSGSMTIRVEGDRHSYEFEYTL